MPHLLCQICGKTCVANTLQWRCTCGGLFDLHFEAELIVDALPHRPHTLWRYREAIPIKDDAHIVTLDEGFTPLTPVTIAGKSLLVKQDHLFPSGSYKDRGATVLISHAHALGVQNMVEDSSGNAGAAIAAYAACAGIACDIYVPRQHISGKTRANPELWRNPLQNPRIAGRYGARGPKRGARTLLCKPCVEPIFLSRHQNIMPTKSGSNAISTHQIHSSYQREMERYYSVPTSDSQTFSNKI